MTAPIDLLMSVIFGASAVLASRTQLRLSPQPWYATRYFAALLTFEGMLVLPASGYRLLFHPDWSFMYLFEASAHPAAYGAASLALLALVGVGTFCVGDFLSRTGRVWALIIVLGLAISGIATIAAVGAERLGTVGTHSQWAGTFGLHPLVETDLLFAVLIMGGCVAVGWVFILYIFIREAVALARTSR